MNIFNSASSLLGSLWAEDEIFFIECQHCLFLCIWEVWESMKYQFWPRCFPNGDELLMGDGQHVERGVSLQKMQKELDKKHLFEAKVYPSWYNHMICPFSQWFYYDNISDVILFSCPGQLNKWQCRSEPTNNQSLGSLLRDFWETFERL